MFQLYKKFRKFEQLELVENLPPVSNLAQFVSIFTTGNIKIFIFKNNG